VDRSAALGLAGSGGSSGGSGSGSAGLRRSRGSAVAQRGVVVGLGGLFLDVVDEIEFNDLLFDLLVLGGLIRGRLVGLGLVKIFGFFRQLFYEHDGVVILGAFCISNRQSQRQAQQDYEKKRHGL
jgi:hypothetical protein